MSNSESQLNALLAGNESAIRQLFESNRGRLTRMVGARMDARVSARFDPSDVVQEALLDAYQRLPTYLDNPSVPLYVWLRKLTWEHLVQLQRKHLGAEKRSVTHEQPNPATANDDSEMLLAERLVSNLTGPTERAIRSETHRRLRAALQLLRPRDREVLELRYLEQMDTGEIAAALEIREGAVVTRHFRAIQRLQELIEITSK